LNYLTTISNLPWNKSEPETTNPSVAQEVLDRDHYGLEQVKKRIIQFLAVRKLK
jgi:ATP-dependent Lon protease